MLKTREQKMLHMWDLCGWIGSKKCSKRGSKKCSKSKKCSTCAICVGGSGANNVPSAGNCYNNLKWIHVQYKLAQSDSAEHEYVLPLLFVSVSCCSALLGRQAGGAFAG